MNNWLLILFFLEIIFFAFSVANIFALRKKRGFLLLFLPLIISAVLGCILFFMTLKQPLGNPIRVFLLLFATAPVAMCISIILHNFVSGGITKLRGGKEFEEPVFFLLAIFGCPAVFLVGMVGTAMSLVRIFFTK